MKFARHYFCKDLEKRGRSYIRQNFTQLIQEGNEFEMLEIDDVIDILQDDELNVRNEEMVFKAVKKWVEANPTKSKRHLLDLLKCVRFGTLTQEFIYNVLQWKPVKDNAVKESYFLNQPQCRKFSLIGVHELFASCHRYYRESSTTIRRFK